MTDKKDHSDNRKSDQTGATAPEFDELARLYLDLWQDQWTALANDPMVAEAMARGFQMMGPGAAAFANFANVLGQANLYAAAKPSADTQAAGDAPGGDDPQGWFRQAGFPAMPYTGVNPPFARNDNNNKPHERPNQPDSQSNTAPGAAPAGATPASSHGDMAQLFDRLAAMEQRLADLASALNGTGGSTGATDQPTGPKRGRRGS
ncbi:MAG: hypothetical protein AAF213_10925 [Pseudomonadota bacterium]